MIVAIADYSESTAIKYEQIGHTPMHFIIKKLSIIDKRNRALKRELNG